MNNVILMGNITKNPEIYVPQDNASGSIVARYTLAVDRRRSSNQDATQHTDFIQCVTFGKSAEFARDYLTSGQKILVSGRIQTGSYIKSDGSKVYTTEVVVDTQESAGRKAENKED